MAAAGRNRLEALGYTSLGEAGVPGREYFRRRGAHDTNLAVVEWRGAHWRHGLLLRDYLRAHPASAEQYGRSKRAAGAGGARTLLAYSAQKADNVTELIEAAERWRPDKEGSRTAHREPVSRSCLRFPLGSASASPQPVTARMDSHRGRPRERRSAWPPKRSRLSGLPPIRAGRR